MNERIRLIIRDAVEGGFTVIGAMTFIAPNSVSGAKALALTLGAAFIGAAYAVLRREALPVILDLIFPKPKA